MSEDAAFENAIFERTHEAEHQRFVIANVFGATDDVLTIFRLQQHALARGFATDCWQPIVSIHAFGIGCATRFGVTGDANTPSAAGGMRECRSTLHAIGCRRALLATHDQ